MNFVSSLLNAHAADIAKKLTDLNIGNKTDFTFNEGIDVIKGTGHISFSLGSDTIKYEITYGTDIEYDLNWNALSTSESTSTKRILNATTSQVGGNKKAYTSLLNALNAVPVGSYIYGISSAGSRTGGIYKVVSANGFTVSSSGVVSGSGTHLVSGFKPVDDIVINKSKLSNTPYDSQELVGVNGSISNFANSVLKTISGDSYISNPRNTTVLTFSSHPVLLFIKIVKKYGYSAPTYTLFGSGTRRYSYNEDIIYAKFNNKSINLTFSDSGYHPSSEPFTLKYLAFVV